MRHEGAARRTVLLAVFLSACQSSVPTAPATTSSPTEGPSLSAEPTVAVTPAAYPSTAPTAVPSASSDPAVAAWASPVDHANVTADLLTLSVRAVPASGATSLASVAFTIAWDANAPRTACTSNTPTAAGTWSCRADLSKLGATPGALSLSFHIDDQTGTVIAPPDAARTVTYAIPPPKPTHTTYTARTGSEYRATWDSPAGFATRFRIYALNDCLRYAKATDGRPCVVKGMAIPAGSLTLLGSVSGDARSMNVRLPGLEGDGLPGPGPGAILLHASNAYGDSRFAILFSDTVCFECVY